MTQRASDSGYALLDTDGIDLDTTTGIHGLSIDLADNTTAGFWAAGSRYWVVISSVTIDAQTVNFIAATFEIAIEGAILSTTIATLSTQTSFTLTSGPAEDDALNGCVVYIHDVASAVQGGYAVVADYTGSTKTVTLAAGTTYTAAATDNIGIFPPSNARWLGATAQTGRDVGASVLLSNGTGAGQVTLTSGRVNADVTHIAAAAVSTSTAQLGVNVVNAAGTAWGSGAITSGAFAAGAINNAAMSIDGSELTAIPWNAAWDAEVQSEASDALNAIGLQYMVSSAVAGANVADNSIMARLVSASATADWDTYDQTADSLEAISASLVSTASLVSGTADSGTTTTMVDAARTEADTDYWKGCYIVFTSGNLAGQVRLITGFNAGTDTITFSPATTQAVSTHTYDIIVGGRVDVGLWAGTAPNALQSGRVDAYLGAGAAGVIDATMMNVNGSEFTAIPWNAAWDAEVQSEVSDAIVASSLDGVPANVAAILADTGTDGVVVNAASLAADAVTEIANGILDLSDGIESSLTLRGAVRIALAALAGKVSGAETTSVVFRNVGDSKNRITATVDTDGNRSAVTTDAT